MPAYNEAPRLPALLARWVEVTEGLGVPHRFVIVDDGSDDETPDLLATFSTVQPAEIITHSANMGMGDSLRDGFRFVANNAADEDFMVVMDADNTQPPELLPEMLERMTACGCDVVIASRYRKGSRVVGLSPLRRFMSFAARMVVGAIIPIGGVRDYTCGYRLYRVGLIKRAFETYGSRFCDLSGFECSLDVLIRLAGMGAKCEEVPMTLRYTEKASASSMRVGPTISSTIRLVIARRWERFRGV